MTPTPRTAWFVGGAALLSLLVPPWVAGLFVVAILGAFVADAFSVRARPEVQGQIPHILSRGVAQPASFMVPEPSQKTRLRQPSTPDLVCVPPESDGSLHLEVTPLRRGRHPLPAVASMTEGPLGLGRWYHGADEAQEVLVYPDLPAARRIALAVREGRFTEPGHLSRGPLGLGTQFESVRDYVPDDDIRQVNWRATARLGRPMSNQFRVEQERDVVCVVDMGRLMSAPAGAERTRLDAAVDAATAVGLVADVVGDRCGVLAFDSEVQRHLPPRRAGGDPLIRSLYDVEPSNKDSDYQLAFSKVGGGKRSFVLVFTDLIDVQAARSLLAGATSLARRHVMAVASVSDPELRAFAEGPVDQGAGDPGDT